MILWCISPRPPLVELRPWVVDEITNEWRPQRARLLASSMNAARALTPVWSYFDYGFGIEPHRTEWWRTPEGRA